MTDDTGVDNEWTEIANAFNNLRDLVSGIFEKAEETNDVETQRDMDRIAVYLDKIEDILIYYVEPETGM